MYRLTISMPKLHISALLQSTHKWWKRSGSAVFKPGKFIIIIILNRICVERNGREKKKNRCQTHIPGFLEHRMYPQPLQHQDVPKSKSIALGDYKLIYKLQTKNVHKPAFVPTFQLPRFEIQIYYAIHKQPHELVKQRWIYKKCTKNNPSYSLPGS